MIKTDTIKQAVDIVGGQAQLAKALSEPNANVSPTFVHQWVKGWRSVPPKYCTKIEALTQGAVSRKDLRPDDWQLYWPELAQVA